MKPVLLFDHSYQVDYVEELTPDMKVFYYPGGHERGGQDGLMARIIADNGNEWIGVFAFGHYGSDSISGIYSMPDKNKFCVISKGAGYIISSHDPSKWEEVKSIPVIDVRCIKSRGIIVFADYTEMIAYEDDGIKWKTARLSYDNLKITQLSDDHIKGEYFDIRSEQNETFLVDLDTGRHSSSAGRI